MIGKVIGALVGQEVARKRQESGLKGAVIGAMAMGLMRRMGPLGLALGGAYAARKAYKRHQEQKAADLRSA